MTTAEDELCRELRAAIAAAFDQEIADKTRIDYDNGWYYYNMARRFSDGSVGTGGSITVGKRKRQIVDEIERIRKMADHA